MKQIKDLQDREQFLSSAIENATKSTQFLVQMETQARSQLEEEKLKTDNLKEELNEKLARFAARVKMEEERYMKIPDYVKLLEIEKEIQIKAAELKKLKDEELAKSPMKN